MKVRLGMAAHPGRNPMDGAARSGISASAMYPPPPLPPRGRFLRAAGLALAVAVLTAGPWTAASAAPSPSRTSAAVRAGSGAGPAAVEAARRFLCPHGGTPTRGGRCRGGGATAALMPGRDLSVRDWDAGLPAAARKQAPCPEGTAQARPLFWVDAVRCVPR